MKLPKALVVYVGGHVHAIYPETGHTAWSTRLPKAYKASTGTVLIEGDIIVAGVGGRVYCLDLSDGRILWINQMPGLGLGMVSMATTRQSTGADAAAHQQQSHQQQAAAGGATAAS
jgi:outer membrane protein assembly factor BamB